MNPFKNYAVIFWISWFTLTLVLCGYFIYAVNSINAGKHGLADIFLPGTSTDGHHQIEMACSVCHTEAFGGPELLQNACTQCHAEELERIEDSHPTHKFTDPRNNDILKKLDARLCIACHTEHRPEITNEMGVTQPDNLCLHCHADVAENRVTHQNISFDSCGSSGCHNFHDNKALYEDFLLKHAKKPPHLPRQTLEPRDLLVFFQQSSLYPEPDKLLQPLDRVQADAPEQYLNHSTTSEDWFSTKHAQAGVNCSDCHQKKSNESEASQWLEKPDQSSCQRCHSDESSGFLEGKHGMRIAVGLSPMTPAHARLPMKKDSHEKPLNCVSCHSAHRFDTKKAATQACLQCHNDEHSKNYLASPHASLWQKEMSKEAPANTGVSCASCHMPRIWHDNEEELERILVDHNQNNTLLPNDKMLRPVCMNCHGLGFSMNALADKELIKNNFNGQPTVHVNSIDMALEADRRHKEKRQQTNSP